MSMWQVSHHCSLSCRNAPLLQTHTGCYLLHTQFECSRYQSASPQGVQGLVCASTLIISSTPEQQCNNETLLHGQMPLCILFRQL